MMSFTGDSLRRAMGGIAYFSLAGPTIGTILFLLLVLITAPRTERVWLFLSWGDFWYTVMDFAAPAAIAGLLFMLLAFFLPPGYGVAAHRTVRGVIGGVAMYLVFGIPVVEKFVRYGQVSRLWLLIAGLAGTTGLILGTLCPQQFLPLPRRATDKPVEPAP
jgi:hypothetical protein